MSEEGRNTEKQRLVDIMFRNKMTLVEAVATGVKRVRRPIWANESAYLKLDLLPGGKRGPWVRLYDRVAQCAIEEPTPQTFLMLNDDHTDWVEYTGPLDELDILP